MDTFEMFVSHTQIAFFDGRLDDPFNDWTEQHVNQGFTWREGSVSFQTLVEGGRITVELERAELFSRTRGAVRAISVPFVCRPGAKIEIATITESQPIPLDPGNYQLVFETGWSGESNWCRFSVIRNGSLKPEILIRDAELTPAYPLLMTAEPAR